MWNYSFQDTIKVRVCYDSGKSKIKYKKRRDFICNYTSGLMYKIDSDYFDLEKINKAIKIFSYFPKTEKNSNAPFFESFLFFVRQ